MIHEDLPRGLVMRLFYASDSHRTAYLDICNDRDRSCNYLRLSVHAQQVVMPKKLSVRDDFAD
jgi:hypothetical protein